MEYSPEEQKILNEIGRPNFKGFGKKEIISLYSSLPNMSKEVAMKALEAFPEFANSTIAVIKEYNDTLIKLMNKHDDVSQESIQSYLSVMEQYKEMIASDELTFDEKMDVCRAMTSVADRIDEIRKDHRDMTMFLIKTACIAAGAGILALLNGIGGNSKIDPPNVS